MPYKLTLVLPAYNEGSRIAEVITRAKQYVDEVIVADDGSQDATAVHARNAGATVVRHRVNLGKGAALKTGVEAALIRHADAIILMDSDGQHPAESIPKLVRDVKSGEADVVFAARELDRRMPSHRRWGNQIVNLFAQRLFNISLHDIWCGFRVFRADVYPRIRWTQRQYYADVEMAINASVQQLRYREIRIPTIYHEAYKGVTIMDGMKLLFTMLLWRFTL